MPKRSRNRDENEAAYDAVQHVIALTEGAKERAEKDPAAVAMGRRGGKKGGPARAAKLTPQQRSESARKAARARWSA